MAAIATKWPNSLIIWPPTSRGQNTVGHLATIAVKWPRPLGFYKDLYSDHYSSIVVKKIWPLGHRHHTIATARAALWPKKSGLLATDITLYRPLKRPL